MREWVSDKASYIEASLLKIYLSVNRNQYKVGYMNISSGWDCEISNEGSLAKKTRNVDNILETISNKFYSFLKSVLSMNHIECARE